VRGRIGSTRQEEVQLEGLQRQYWQYKALFENEKAEILAPRQTFDHAINLKDGATPPWGPIYPMSAYQLAEFKKYLHKMLVQGKLGDSKSPAGAPILFVPKPDTRVWLSIDNYRLNKLSISKMFSLDLESPAYPWSP